jgi:hypothetical protein
VLLVLVWLAELKDELETELAELADCPAEFVEELTAELAEETGAELEDEPEPEPVDSTPPPTLAGEVLPCVFAAAAAYSASVLPDELFAKISPLVPQPWSGHAGVKVRPEKEKHLRRVDDHDHALLAMLDLRTVEPDRIGVTDGDDEGRACHSGLGVDEAGEDAAG